MTANVMRVAAAGAPCHTRSVRAGRDGHALMKVDLRTFFDVMTEPYRIPIGETYAAVRLRLSDLRRFGRAMDAVALSDRQSDPVQSDRIVRARLDGERFGCLDVLETVFR